MNLLGPDGKPTASRTDGLRIGAMAVRRLLAVFAIAVASIATVLGNFDKIRSFVMHRSPRVDGSVRLFPSQDAATSDSARQFPGRMAVLDQASGVADSAFGTYYAHIDYAALYSYASTRESNGTLRITPGLSSFVDQRSRGLIVGRLCGYYSAPNSTASFPILDVQLANNTQETLIIDEAHLEVAKSAPDTLPLLDLYGVAVRYASMVVVNQGWSPIDRIVVEFNLLGMECDTVLLDRVGAWRKPYAHRMEISGFAYTRVVSFEEALHSEVSDPQFLRKYYDGDSAAAATPTNDIMEALAAAAAPLVDGVKSTFNEIPIVAVGTMSIYVHGTPTPYPMRFCVPLNILPPKVGGGELEASAAYDVALRTSGERYEVAVPLSLWAKPGDPLRILIRVGAAQTSMHHLRLVLFGNGRRVFRSGPVDCTILVPKESAMSSHYAAVE